MADVYLEVGKKKVFAGSIDWPGWGRFAKTEEEALEALAAYGPRYEPIAVAAGFKFPAAPRLSVVERVPGTATTEFGAPDGHPGSDGALVTAANANRHTKLLRADVIAALAHPNDGGPLTTNGWTARYAARRFTWHVLDHLWEMEDRSE